ncbi:MAG: hypothetical protein JRF02_03730 [Deltaproteobacteria bacterium]|jgi:hypothetical protein|nr:hypothetical protein [Deltaproteobacteria bacterium]
MVDVSFEINGRTVQPDSMQDVLDILFLKHVREKINDSLSSVCCAIHGKKPSVIVRGSSLDSLNYEVSGCCKDFVDKVRKKIK